LWPAAFAFAFASAVVVEQKLHSKLQFYMRNAHHQLWKQFVTSLRDNLAQIENEINLIVNNIQPT